MDTGNLFRELSRRRVLRVLAAYAIVAWLVVQVSEVAFNAFDLPPWALQLVIALALVGLPVVGVLAWAFDVTDRGIERTASMGSTGDGGAAESTRPRKLIAGLVVVAGLGAATLTVMRFAGNDPQAFVGDPRQSVIVFPFENITGAADLDYLQDASANLLGLALSHWTEMRVFDDERTGSLLRRRDIDSPRDIDFDAAVDMGHEAAVGTFVLGEFRRERDSLVIEAKVYDLTSGDRIATEVARVGDGQDPRTAFNTLAAGILDVSGAPPGERPDLLAQTTGSLEAYRAYLAGTRAFQLFQIDSAFAYLRRAIEIDSTFALAYLRLRDVEGWAGLEQDPRRRRAWVALAMAYSDGLPPRYASLVRFHDAYESGRFRRAREIAEQMIARDSSDVEAWYQLGEAHFHHNPNRIPHADTLGDYGSALFAFQRTLELDSTYALAYQHVIDVLANCGAETPWLCVDGGTVYGPRDELIEQFGEAEIAANRQRAHEARIEAAYAWVATSPRTTRARSALVALLIESDRLDEARNQVEVLRAQGDETLAASWESRLALRGQDYGAAGRSLDQVFLAPDGLQRILADQPGWMFAVLLGGGRPTQAGDALETLLGLIPTDTITGPDNISYVRALFDQYQRLSFRAAIGQETELLSAATHAWLDALDNHYEPGTPRHETRWLNSGGTVLAAYLAAGDTTLLSRFVALADTARSRTWRTMLAHLAFERGDTEAARALLDTHFAGRDDLEVSGDVGAVRLFGWARLLELFEELQGAADAYALFDVEASPNIVRSLDSRSWYERGRLLEALGRPEEAVEQYRRFIDAWADGDAVVQPLVEEAHASVATLAEG